MTNISETCRVEIWRISHLLDACSRMPQGRDSIVVPRYKRGLVWTQREKQALIDSIRKGFPFGSFYLYDAGECQGKRRHEVIDGLQRLHAIRKYADWPTRYIPVEEIDEGLTKLLVEMFGKTGEGAQEEVCRALVDWVRSRKGFLPTDGWGISELARFLVTRLLDENIATDESRSAWFELISNRAITSRLAQFLDDVKSRADIRFARAPVYIYTGAREQIPKILQLLN